MFLTPFSKLVESVRTWEKEQPQQKIQMCWTRYPVCLLNFVGLKAPLLLQKVGLRGREKSSEGSRLQREERSGRGAGQKGEQQEQRVREQSKQEQPSALRRASDSMQNTREKFHWYGSRKFRLTPKGPTPLDYI